jgi:pre-mRNA-splicing helicase BRR2
MADQSQYKYANMSNLVLQADRRFISRRTDEPTGDPETLAGKVDIKEMGSRVLRDIAPKEKAKKRKGDGEKMNLDALEEGREILERERRKRKREYVSLFRRVKEMLIVCVVLVPWVAVFCPPQMMSWG